jgi:hypothetical protein
MDRLIKIIKHDSEKAFQKFMDEEIKAQPDNVYFKQFKDSELVKGIFERGFTSGIVWQKKHEDCKFVVSKNE